MRLPVPISRKPSPRPRTTDGDPPDEARRAQRDAASTGEDADVPAVPTTVSVTSGAAAHPDSAPAGSTESDPADAVSSADSEGSAGGEGTADDEETADDEGTADGDKPRGRGAAVKAALRPRRVIAAVLVLAVLGGLGFAASLFFGQRAEEQARTEALGAAKRYAVDLSSYDHQNLDGNFQAVERNATGQFGQQYRQVSNNLTKLLKQHKATSKGNVVRAGVAEASADRAVVVLFVDQTISNTNTEKPRVDRNRMEMALVRQDDRWLVDKVTLL